MCRNIKTCQETAQYKITKNNDNQNVYSTMKYLTNQTKHPQPKVIKIIWIKRNYKYTYIYTYINILRMIFVWRLVF